MKRFNIKTYIKAFEEFEELRIIAAGAYPKNSIVKREVVIADKKRDCIAESIELTLTIFEEHIKVDIRLKAATKEQVEYLANKIDYTSRGGFSGDIRTTYYFKEEFKEHEEALEALRDFCKLYYKKQNTLTA